MSEVAGYCDPVFTDETAKGQAMKMGESGPVPGLCGNRADPPLCCANCTTSAALKSLQQVPPLRE